MKRKSPDRMRALLDRQPFEPFTVHTGDGSTVHVLSKEFAFLYPGGRTLRVVTPMFRGAAEEGDFEEHTIDVFLITKVSQSPSQRPRGRRKAS
jgi:hypothetical protein